MKWPWVSREAYAQLDSEAEYLAARVETLERQQTELLTAIIAMKREGFHPVQAMPAAPVQQEDRLPDVIEDALDTIGLTGQARIQHADWAKRQLTKERDPEVVASELLRGGMPNG